MKKKKSTNEISTFGFFKYFQNIVGYHMYTYLALNCLVGLLDGFGLAMFVPLLKVASGTGNDNASLGRLRFLADFIERLGLDFNITTVLGFMVLLFILKGICYYARILYFIRIRLKAIREIRFNLILRLKNLSFEKFTSMNSGKIQNTMVGETGRLISSMISFFGAIQHVIMLLTYIGLAFMSNWKFAIMVSIGGLVTNFIYKYINNITKEYSRRISAVGHGFNGSLIESILHFKYLKATNRFKNWEGKLKRYIGEGEEYNYKIGKIGAVSESLREPIIILIIAIVLLIQINVMKGEFASIMVSLLLFYRALAHLATMQNQWNSFISTSAGLESVNSLLNEFKENEEPQHENKINHIRNISLQNIGVTFGENEILKDINLSIKPKTSIAFVGESGAGKTTLANVICGLLQPHRGDLIIDGQKLSESDIGNFRDRVGYITQEPVIFNGTIYENVTFWAEKTQENMDKFHAVMKMASLDGLLDSLGKKEDARVGDNGILISGGQKQRISIARELFKEVELLIMDEATSALDSETETFIKENIDMLHGKMTMVIIAHRLSTIKNVDNVYLMEKGEIINNGTFSELSQKSEKFGKMVALQEVSS